MTSLKKTPTPQLAEKPLKQDSTPLRNQTGGGPPRPEPLAKTSPRPEAKKALSDLAFRILLFQRKEAKSDKPALMQMAQEIQAEAEKALPLEPGLLLGILALCAIPGHDVHFLNSELKIDQHIAVSSPLEGRLQEARELLLKRADYLCAIFVFENTYKYLSKNGDLSDDDVHS